MSIVDIVRKTFVYSGRTTRMEYWGSLLVLFLGLCILSGVEVALYDDAYLGTLYMIVAILSILSLSVRRLHDAGYSGIWLWLFLAIGVLLLFLLPPTAKFPLGGLFGIFLYGLFKRSEPGTNKYGPNPHNRKKQPSQKSKKQIMQTVTCPSCGSQQQAKAKFCTSCGTSLRSSSNVS